ncbi:hypothetical protein LCGC14_1176020 [marine sediment metagenome]|uniref:Uncharacterized protein n=1 Tax=marine sediment metagenome TaxID=412755 RepID=A0A0F9LNH8_9ZZZZ
MNPSTIAITATLAAVASLLTACDRPTRIQVPAEIGNQPELTHLCTYQIEPESIERAPLVPDLFQNTYPSEIEHEAGWAPPDETHKNDRLRSRLFRWIQNLREKRELRKARRAERRAGRRERRDAR